MLSIILSRSIGNFSEFSYRTRTLRGERCAAYEVDVAMRPPQARVSLAKLFVMFLTDAFHTIVCRKAARGS